LLKVGLTGGAACGKSKVGELFAARGAQVVRADEIAHQLMAPGQPVYQEILRHFGGGVLDADGAINRQKLAEAAFGGGRVEELNRIVHPAVIAHQDRWMAEIGARDPSMTPSSFAHYQRATLRMAPSSFAHYQRATLRMAPSNLVWDQRAGARRMTPSI